MYENEAKRIMQKIENYKKASDELAEALDELGSGRELTDRIESFCLSYDEHLMLNHLRNELEKQSSAL